jgi:hypothetical protein
MKWYDPDASPAATASNWWQVVLVDLLLGISVTVAGVILSFTWSALWGSALAALGVLYVFAVIRRGQGWKARRELPAGGEDDVR